MSAIKFLYLSAIGGFAFGFIGLAFDSYVTRFFFLVTASIIWHLARIFLLKELEK